MRFMRGLSREERLRRRAGECPGDGGRHASMKNLEVDWLPHVIECATAEATVGEFEIILAAHHDDWHRSPPQPHLLEHLDPRHAGHADVQEHSIGLMAL